MKRLFWLLLFVSVLTAGCATGQAKKDWDEAMKDLRGDNMKMGQVDIPSSGNIRR